MADMTRPRRFWPLVPAGLAVVLLLQAVGCNRKEERGPSDPGTGLSSVVAARFVGVPAGFPAGSAPDVLPSNASLADYVKALVAHADTNFNFANETWNPGSVPAGFAFPLENTSTGGPRQVQGLEADIVLRWLDPITSIGSGPRFGANCDYNAFFGDGWNSVANGWTGGPQGVLGNAPQWGGDPDAGYLWTNHEFMTGRMPTTTSAPSHAHMILAKQLFADGVLTNDVASNVWAQADVDTYIREYKRQLGGSYVRIAKDGSGRWVTDPGGAFNKRFDGTSDTLLRMTGYTPSAAETNDAGVALPAGVVPGTFGGCSGGQSPWGTVMLGEENVQDFYGDLEACWNNDQRFTAGSGFDAGASVNPPFAPSTSGDFGRISNPAERHRRDSYGWVAEIDPEQPPTDFYESTATAGDGLGHRKVAGLGRVRHENVTFVTGTNWKLIPNQPIVLYSANDRRGGRIYRFVSTANYTSGMTRDQVRALLDDGRLYVAQFADLHNDQGRAVGATTTRGGVTITLPGGNAGAPSQASPGNGVWIELALGNTSQSAPNAGSAVPAGHSLIGTSTLPALTVGAALADTGYNGLGGFATDDLVRACAFTACAKLGIRELNRPEDIEWNPWGFAGGTGATPLLYVSFTGHTGRTCCDRNGVLLDPADDHGASNARDDVRGRVWAISHGGTNPATATTFTFWEVHAAPNQPGSMFEFANPDNLVVDRDGGVWFGTDGYTALSGRAEGFYYLDTNPAHSAAFGRAFRVIAAPRGAEATGPCFSPDMKTFFYSAQHPTAGFP